MATVLLVDDTASVRAALRRILRRAGYDVVTAESGEEALAVARERDLLAVVVDYQMPGMDGLTLLGRLRQVRQALPAVLVSGALDLDVVMRAVNRAGAAKVLAKPVTAAELVAAVDGAVRRQESVGRRWAESRDLARIERRDALRSVLDGDGLRLALQPIVRATDRRVVAWEGLLRTQAMLDSTPSVLGNPEHLLSAAEEEGRLHDVTFAVAKRAADWLRFIPVESRLFLNIHPDELRDPETLTESLGPVRRDAGRVVIEVTERAALDAGGTWREAIEALRADGFGIAIDDLGAGSSSLTTLADLDPSVIKLDRALIQRVHSEPRKRRIVEMLQAFAAATGVEVVAEGIEDDEEAEVIGAIGVGLMQGYHFGRPSAELDVVLGDVEPTRRPRPRSGTRLKSLPRPEGNKKRGTGS